MKIAALSRVSPGAVLSKSIFSSNGQPLLNKGVKLSASYIAKLEQMGFKYVYIDDTTTVDIKDMDSIPSEVRQEVVGRIANAFQKLNHSDGVHRMVKSGELGREFLNIYRILFSHLEQSNTMVVHLSALYSSDAHTYTHCMNVATITTILALAHGYSKQVVEELGVGAMMHDIGKIEISPAIVNKPGKLTDEEFALMKRHCRLGYEILATQPDLPPSSAVCALYHHEWYDGNGYPEGLRGTDIPEFARLMAVADVYDALTSNRAYHKPWLPSDALEFIFTRTYKQFDPTFVRYFTNHVSIYPVGITVRLSNGTTGIVAKPGKDNLQRPTVLITEDQGKPVTPFEIDLSTDLNVTIVGCEL
ncbi:HD-GYP domain-containing protein [Alicyclobacillus tolerans]|uniref:HD-GYP domain-containing protein n=1 Tax=Alicyclobacillus tolerans TaxID=90970 RepID=UPI001F2B3E79|nr:HD-GYP domain-containing protein [Alicyclobacillus tolerans]MCF8565114.1 HD-GYP domain-containing protein [Alicyclobacillus tolerans]